MRTNKDAGVSQAGRGGGRVFQMTPDYSVNFRDPKIVDPLLQRHSMNGV